MQCSPKLWIYLISSFALFAAAACKSDPASSASTAKSAPAPTPAIAQNSTAPDIDLNCVTNHIQNPRESFRYTFTDESSNPWKEEANVTPQRIDGSFSNSSLPKLQEFHGTPQEVSSNFRAVGRMASLFAIVHNTSAVLREGTETLNGYDTVKYSIDTARGNTTEQALYTKVLGPGGSAKGTIWVADQGCPVKLDLNEELHSKDGSLTGKTHYEEAMVKK
jgi:hypothetical protein